MANQIQINLTPLDYYALYLGNVYDWSIPIPPQTYLWRRYKESQEDFQDRGAKTVYDPWVRKVVDIQTSYVMAGAKASQPPDTFDIYALARDIVTHAYIGGYCYVLTLPSGPRVYPCLIDGYDSMGAKAYPCYENGQRVWKFGTDRKFEIRFDAALYDQGLGIGLLTEYTGDTVGGVISTSNITPAQFQKVCWNTTETSLVKDVARLALQIFNLQSVYDYAAERLGSFYLFGPTIEGSISPAPGAYLSMTSDMATPGVTAWADTNAVEALARIIDSKVRKLAQGVGLMDEFAEDVKIESGIAMATRMTKNGMVTAAMADAANNACNNASAEWGRLNGRDDIPTISISREVKPDARKENLDILKLTAEFTNDPETYYQARRLAVQSAFEGLTQEEMETVNESLAITGRQLPSTDPYGSFGNAGISGTESVNPGAEEPEDVEDPNEPPDNEDTSITKDQSNKMTDTSTAQVKRDALNGAQITAQIGVVQAYAEGVLSRESALSILQLSFNLSDADSNAILGPVKVPQKPVDITK